MRRAKVAGQVMLALVGGLGITASFAGNMGDARVYRGTQMTDGGYVWSISGGPAWFHRKNGQILNIDGTYQEGYVQDGKTGTVGFGELFFGMQQPVSDVVRAEYGIALDAASNAKMVGRIWQDGLPDQANSDYSYKVNPISVGLKGKWLFDVGYGANPYVSGRVGVSFNRSHGYSNQPKIATQVPIANFTSHNKTAVAYGVGVGIDQAVNDNLRVGVGYEFADWGKSGLGKRQYQTASNGLSLKHLYTHGLQVSLTCRV